MIGNTLILFVLVGCNVLLENSPTDPMFDRSADPYCDWYHQEQDESGCEKYEACCDGEDCWFLFEDQQFDCESQWECDAAIDALISEACNN